MVALESATAAGLCQALKPYVIASASPTAAQIFWPAVREAKLYLPSEILALGISIVDLPGVGDINIAREKATNRLRAECHCFWVVSELARAQTCQKTAGKTPKYSIIYF
jgi:hypothetical protein